MQKIIEIVRKILEGLNKNKRYFVAYHFDIDGCCSASLLWRFFEKENIKAEFSPALIGYEQLMMDKISANSPDEIIMLDYIPPNQEFIQYLKRYKVTIIDHHIHEAHFDEFNYFTSHDVGSDVSVSYFLSETLHAMGFSNVEWLGKLGAFWDKVIEKTKYNYEGVYEKEIEKMLPFNMIVNFSNVRGSQKVFKILNESSSFEEALDKITDTNDYLKAKKIFDTEFKGIVRNRQYDPQIKLAVYNIKTKFKHIRIYVDYICFPSHDTNIFVNNEIHRFKLSFRTSMEIDLQKILKEIAKINKDFTGGGHKKACGALLNNNDLNSVMLLFKDLYTQEFRKLHGEAD